MDHITNRATAVWAAVVSLLVQLALMFDQACNVLLGLGAIVVAAWTGEEQSTCYADETLSAHAFRSWRKGKPWGELMKPPIDALFFWQRREPAVDAVAGRPVASHCERAFWKKKLRLGLPTEYRE